MLPLKIPAKWLELFKLQINRPYDDKDDLYLMYLENATYYVFTQYLETPREKLQEIKLHRLHQQILHAILNVATTYEQNPEINMVNDFGTVVDQKMLYRILGGFTEYFQSEKYDGEWRNIFEWYDELDPGIEVEPEKITVEMIMDRIQKLEDETKEIRKDLIDEVGKTADLIANVNETLTQKIEQLQNETQQKINWPNETIPVLGLHDEVNKSSIKWNNKGAAFGFENNKLKALANELTLTSDNPKLTKSDGTPFTPHNNNNIVNKKYVDDSIAAIPKVDLSDYYNKLETDEKIAEEIAKIPEVDLSNYYTKNETYNKTETDAKIADEISKIPSVDLSDYYTKSETYNKSETEQKIDEKIAAIPPVDLSDYYNKTETEQKIDEKIAQIPATDLSNVAFVNKSNRFIGNQWISGKIIDSQGFYTENASAVIGWINNQGAKNYYLDFEQPSAGFRNYTNIVYRVKNGSNKNFDEVFKIGTRNTGAGIHIFAESQKIIFDGGLTLLKNVNDPVDGTDAANKTYVDNKSAQINTDIETLRNTTERIKNELENANLVNYKGKWSASANYRAGNIVNDEDAFYLAIVANTNKKPKDNKNEWKHIDFTIDTSAFVDKNELTTALNTKLDKTEFATEKNNLMGELNKKVNLSELDNYYNKGETEQKITEKINSISTLAYTNKTNIFTQNQQIRGNTAFIQFNNGNTRVGYVGKPSSTTNDVEFRADTNSLKLSAKHNIILDTGAGYEVLSSRAPTSDSAVANKKYVDDKVATIPRVDLTPYAKKGENNFLNPQSFLATNPWIDFRNSAGKVFGSIQAFADKMHLKTNYENLDLISKKNINLQPELFAIYDKTPTANNHIANKKYVDDAIAAAGVGGGGSGGNINTANLAKLNEVNTFTKSQIIKETNPYINLMNQNGVSIGKVGKTNASSNDINLEGGYGSINVSAGHKVILKAGGNYGVEMSGAITQNNHVVNKKYVDDRLITQFNQLSQADNVFLDTAKRYTDDEVAKIQVPSSNEFFVKNDWNISTAFNKYELIMVENYFKISHGQNALGNTDNASIVLKGNDSNNAFVQFSCRTLTNLKLTNDDITAFDNNNSAFMPVSDASIITKKALDAEIAKIPKTEYIKPYYNSSNVSSTIKKIHINSDVYSYSINKNLEISVPSQFKGKKISVVGQITSISNVSSGSETGCTVGFEYNTQGAISTETFNVRAVILSTKDLLVGTSGEFSGRIYYRYVIMESW